MADVTFFFDPSCPWTWRASRWLTLVAETRDLDVEWRPLSLWVVNDRDVIDPVRRARMETAHRWLRVAQRLYQEGRQDDIARLYTATGEIVHDHDSPFDEPVLVHVLREADLVDFREVLDDSSLDEAVEAATSAAQAAAGPGAGSPVMVLRGVDRGLHGPVLGAVPDKAAALALWEAVEALAPIEEFFELKRGRR
jgi:hypothetical protein